MAMYRSKKGVGAILIHVGAILILVGANLIRVGASLILVGVMSPTLVGASPGVRGS
jgi:hypothetical protein